MMHIHIAQSGCPLSPKELEAVEWLSKGKSLTEIGQVIGAHRWTIGRRIKTAYSKTGAGNYQGLVGMAYREGWIR